MEPFPDELPGCSTPHFIIPLFDALIMIIDGKTGNDTDRNTYRAEVKVTKSAEVEVSPRKLSNQSWPAYLKSGIMVLAQCLLLRLEMRQNYAQLKYINFSFRMTISIDNKNSKLPSSIIENKPEVIHPRYFLFS